MDHDSTEVEDLADVVVSVELADDDWGTEGDDGVVKAWVLTVSVSTLLVRVSALVLVSTLVLEDWGLVVWRVPIVDGEETQVDQVESSFTGDH